jgi:hypothetical protein
MIQIRFIYKTHENKYFSNNGIRLTNQIQNDFKLFLSVEPNMKYV